MILKYFEEGREAYRQGLFINPYPADSEPGRSWDAGTNHEWFEEITNSKVDDN